VCFFLGWFGLGVSSWWGWLGGEWGGGAEWVVFAGGCYLALGGWGGVGRGVCWVRGWWCGVFGGGGWLGG